MSKDPNVPIIELKDVEVVFTTRAGSILHPNKVKAVNKVNLRLMPGKTIGIVGESGCGKSTTANVMCGLQQATSGQVLFKGQDVTHRTAKERMEIGRVVSVVFQDPATALNARMSVIDQLIDPLVVHKLGDKASRDKHAHELLRMVGLPESALYALPGQLSGGQRQRVAIARALSTEPKVLLCDEATSALDPSTTASILNLLRDINRRLGVTVVIITHEMSVIEQICNRVAIISESRIAECGTVEEVFSNPRTDAARRLVLPEGRRAGHIKADRLYRIVFNGSSSLNPVIADMILECKAPVNIIHADMRDMDGKAFGQIVVQLPEDTLTANKMIAYLQEQGLTAEEVQL